MRKACLLRFAKYKKWCIKYDTHYGNIQLTYINRVKKKERKTNLSDDVEFGFKKAGFAGF